MAIGSEVQRQHSSLQNDQDLNASYGATQQEAGNRHSSKASFAWSSISDRFIHTERFCGFMIPPDFCHVMACCTFTIVASLTVSFTNSLLLKNYKFPCLCVQLFQAFFGIIWTVFVGHWAHKLDSNSPFYWPKVEFKFRRFLSLFPISVLFVLRVFVTNMAMSKAQLSSYQILRQTSILFSCLLSALLLGDIPTWRTILSLFIIIASVVVIHNDPLSMTLSGFLWSLSSGVFASIYTVAIKPNLVIVNHDHRLMLLYSAYWSFLLIPVIFFNGESTAFVAAFNSADRPSWKVGLALLVSMMSGFIVNISAALLVKASSPVTYDMVGKLKMICVFFGSVLLLSDVPTVRNVIGNILAIVGGLYYAYSKYLDHRTKVFTAAVEAKKAERAATKQEVV